MSEASDAENIRQAVLLGIITKEEAFAAIKAINTGDNHIIKELYRERFKNEQTLDAG